MTTLRALLRLPALALADFWAGDGAGWQVHSPLTGHTADTPTLGGALAWQGREIWQLASRRAGRTFERAALNWLVPLGVVVGVVLRARGRRA